MSGYVAVEKAPKARVAVMKHVSTSIVCYAP